MRKLVWFTVGYTVGTAGAIWVLEGRWILPMAVTLFILSFAVGFIYSPGINRRITAFILAGFAVSLFCFWAYNSCHISKARNYDDTTDELEILIIDYGTITENGGYAVGELEIEGTTHKVITFLNEQLELYPGDRIVGDFYLQYTGTTGDTSYYFGEGVYLKAYATNDTHIRFEKGFSFSVLSARLRHSLKKRLENIFPSDVEGFANALLLGDSDGLSKEVDNNFQNSGIRHIIAVSGLHVSFLFSFVHELFGKRRYLTALIGIPVLILFAGAAGFTPSVMRACVMQILLIGSMLFNKEYDPPTALAVAVLILLGADPLAITSVGFQLSVGCVVGVFLFSSRINRYITSRKCFGDFSGKSRKAKLKRMIASSVSVSLSAMSLTIPLSAHYFGVVCTIGVITNLFTLWAVTYVFCGIVICIILSLIFQPLAIGLGWLLAWLMRYILWVSGVLAQIPFAVVAAENTYIVVCLLFSYLMVFVVLLSKEKKVMLLICCILSSFAVSLLLSVSERKQNQFCMTVLDVGQGQCILLQSGDQYYMVDCGGTSPEGTADLAVRTLRTQGINCLDGIILTHFDMDHAGGIESLMSQVTVDRLYFPDIEPDNTVRLSLEKQYDDRIQWVTQKDYLHLDHAVITLIPPKNGAEGNNGCMSILFQVENCDILITGDLQSEGEQYLMKTVRLPEIEILVAGHHGADNATTMGLLNKTKPATVVISVGEENNFGHPAISLLHRLELFGCKVWRTDQNGMITFRG